MTERPALAAPPRIGLTTYRETAAWGVWHESADLLPASYADAVTLAGGAALLLPPAAAPPDTQEYANAVLDGLDGLIVSGGPDVDPARYGAERDVATGPPRPGRDGWELELTRATLRREIPLLAICRGMQVLNVALGGTLVQHLPDLLGHTGHCPVVGEHARHEVRIADGGRLGPVLGEQVEVASYHHQGLDVLGAGLTAIGWTEDGVVEAIECAGAGWAVGVQWHPEVHAGAALFAAFVAACAARRAEHSGQVPA